MDTNSVRIKLAAYIKLGRDPDTHTVITYVCVTTHAEPLRNYSARNRKLRLELRPGAGSDGDVRDTGVSVDVVRRCEAYAS